jgi:hypothetical protein
VIESEGAEFCPHHLRLAAEYGAELVKEGAVPKRRRHWVAEEPGPPVVTARPRSTAVIDPTSF